jgi:hypothetical protein
MHSLRYPCVAILTACLFAGCGKPQEKKQTQPDKATPPEESQPVAKQISDTPGAATKAEPAGSATKAKPAGSATKAKPAGSATKAKPAGSATKAKPAGSATKAKPAGSTTKAETKAVSGSAPKDDASTAAVDVETKPNLEPPPEPEVDDVDPAIARKRLEAIPVFEKAERVGDVIETTKDVRINYTHTSAPTKVHDYYRLTLRKDGWIMGRPRLLDDGGNAIAFSKDGQMILVVVEGLGEHSVRMLTGPQ